MNGSTKTFIASIIIFACSIGFFAGSFFGGKCCMMQNCKKDCPMMQHMAAPDFGHGKAHKNHRGDFHKKNHGDFHKKHHPGFDKEKGKAFMDSLLQVTPEQKTSLEKQRNEMDQSFKEFRKQKMEAERDLKQALDSGDSVKINEAKSKVLAAQENLLNKRIEGVRDFRKILTAEQLEKFHAFEKERFEKFHKKHGKHLEPGDHPDQGPAHE